MKDTPRTDEHEANLIGCCREEIRFSEMARFASQLERELAEQKDMVGRLECALELGQENCEAVYDDLRKERDDANHLRERAESSLSGAAARMRAAQDESDMWQARWGQAVDAIAYLQQPAKLGNTLHDILDEMDSRGGNAIQRLAAYIRACDPERKAKAMIAFRDDLECYDRKMAPTTHPETPVK